MLKSKFKWVKYSFILGIFVLLTSCLSLVNANQKTPPTKELSPGQWRVMDEEEEQQAWQYVLNSPLGIAALNQLAIEGFISPLCPKTFYVNDESFGFQSLLRVECPEPQGVSTAIGYDEIRVIFNRFESNIENFSVERVSEETGEPTIDLGSYEPTPETRWKNSCLPQNMCVI